ncbi:MAG: hypothetical protein LBE84_03540, partial [Planctomycetota bacterium]|nr:hypothetical protein [Planctomycetota bacterium]
MREVSSITGGRPGMGGRLADGGDVSAGGDWWRWRSLSEKSGGTFQWGFHGPPIRLKPSAAWRFSKAWRRFPSRIPAGGGETVGTANAEQPKPLRLFDFPESQARNGRPTDELTGLPFEMETVSTEGVLVEPKLFQFKRDLDEESGVKKGQELKGKVNPVLLGNMVFFEDVDGQRFVVSGHHRMDLIRRSGREEEVRAAILREADGWTPEAARVYGAAINIQDGGGDIDDYVNFFRETRGKIDRDRAETEGLLRRENARLGFAIGALGGDNVFTGFLSGELSARRAAAIANAAPGNAVVQDMMLERKVPTNELETFAGYVLKMRNSGKLNLGDVQLSLFASGDDAAMLAAMQRESREAAKQADELEKKAKALEGLLKAGNTLSTADLRKHGARAGDREGLRLEVENLRVEADRWRKFFLNPDILSQVQERAGTAVKPSETFNQDTRPAEEQIADLYEMTQAIPENNNLFADIGSVTAETAKRVKEKTGIDITGYTFVIDSSGIKHALDKHGVGKETEGDQQPITRDDFILIPEVLAHPEQIESAGKNDMGNDLIRFSKNFNGMLYVVEERRTGRRKLALQTIYKKKGLPSRLTSETLLSPKQAPRETSPSQQSTILPAAPDVNAPETFEQADGEG